MYDESLPLFEPAQLPAFKTDRRAIGTPTVYNLLPVSFRYRGIQVGK
jgi:hypothetical protein